MKACAGFSSFSPPASGLRVRRSGTRSSGSSCAALSVAQARLDPFGLLAKLPVIGPGRARHGHRDMRLEAFASCSHGLLVRVAPAIPRPLDRAVDELQP